MQRDDIKIIKEAYQYLESRGFSAPSAEVAERLWNEMWETKDPSRFEELKKHFEKSLRNAAETLRSQKEIDSAIRIKRIADELISFKRDFSAVYDRALEFPVLLTRYIKLAGVILVAYAVYRLYKIFVAEGAK